MKTKKLTTSQALISFLKNQYVQRDDRRTPFFAGVWGIFGHGNVAGIGEALQQSDMPYYLSRNEQAMTHTAIAYSKAMNRMSTFACTSSVGPGATNMVTGAATATINRIPLLLLPGDTFARRNVAPVLQQLEVPWSQDISVNDSFKPVSRFWDRINRPDQLPWSLLEAMRVLTSPDETGAVTICLPQDVQTETGIYPVRLFEERTWTIPRLRPDTGLYRQALNLIRNAKKPFIIAGGGVLYSEATDELDKFASRFSIPVGETQAGKGSLPWDHPFNMGAIGATGSKAANSTVSDADLVICIGTRLADFTTASKSLFNNPDVRFLHINVCAMDTVKLGALPLQGDAKVTLSDIIKDLGEVSFPKNHSEEVEKNRRDWHQELEAILSKDVIDGRLQQPAIVGAINSLAGPQSTVVCAAGSLPGDLHKLWKTSEPGGYHLEYGYSCMGYEIAGGIGVKMARPERHVIVMVGDGSYQMLSSELVTAIQEGIKIIVVILNNHGFGSIGALSESVGSSGFGTNYKFRNQDSGELDGNILPLDLAMNARSYGVEVHEAESLDDVKKYMKVALDAEFTQAIVVNVDKKQRVPSYGWWEVPVAEVSGNENVMASRKSFEEKRKQQKFHY